MSSTELGHRGEQGTIKFWGTQESKPFFSKWIWHQNHLDWDFPGGTVIKNPPANAGDTGSSPGPGRSHMPWSN